MTTPDYGTGVCVQCGHTFQKMSSIQKYCGLICKRKAQNQQCRDWMRQFKEELRQEKKKMEAQKKKPSYTSFKEFADMNEKARAAGMSYGKYVALLREGRINSGH